MDVLTTISDLEALAPEWTQLWAQDPTATVFQGPEWLLPWWRHVGMGELHTLALRDRAGRLAGLLPLYIYTQPATGERHLLLLGAGTSDYLGGIFAPTADSGETASQAGYAEQVAQCALLFLARGSALWDRAILHQLHESSPLLRWARQAGWPVTRAEDCSSIAVNGWARLPAKLRLNSGRYRRRAEARGQLRFTIATAAADALANMDHLVALHQRRWQERGESGVLSSAAVQQHHRETIPKLLEAGRLRMFSCELDGRVIAVLYAFLENNGTLPLSTAGMACYLIGFDPDVADLSPGTLLLSYAFDRCITEGIGRLNLLRGGEAYKQLWGAIPEKTYTLETAPSCASALLSDSSRLSSRDDPSSAADVVSP